MKIAFFGTPDYVVPILEKLHKSFKSKGTKSPISAVVTQPPKPVGRKHELSYSPVDGWAFKKKVPIIFDPIHIIKDNVEADVGVLASYGKLIPENLINYFPFGILVIHPSLLPQFRWSSPVQASIVCGANPTGATIIKMDKEFDHGPIVTQFKEEILDNDNSETLRNRLFLRSADVMVSLLPAYLNGKIKPKPQDHDKATFSKMIKNEDAYIPLEFLKNALKGKASRKKWEISFIKDYSQKPEPLAIERFIRAMYPWPCAWT